MPRRAHRRAAPLAGRAVDRLDRLTIPARLRALTDGITATERHAMELRRQRDDLLMAAYRAGHDLRTIGEWVGMDAASVSRALRRRGYRLRPRGPRPRTLPPLTG